MNIYKTVLIAIVIIAMSAGGVQAMQKFTPELMNQLGRVSEPKVSPDGKKVLFGVATPDIKENKSNSDLWLMDIDGKNARQLTDLPTSVSNGVWMAGGSKIAYVCADADKIQQVWVMNADGTDARCVSKMKKDVEGFVLSPDEKKIVIISTVKYRETTQDLYPDLDKTDGRIIDDLMYRHWNEWTKEIPHPFLADFDGNTCTNVKDVLEGTQFESPMRPMGGVEQITWMPDSKSFIYVCRKKTGKDYAVSTNSNLFKYTIETGSTENLTEGMMGYDNRPVVAPKSNKIAFLSMEHDGYESDKNRIFVMDADGSNKVDLTADWDYSSDEIAWSPDEKYIYFIGAYLGTMPIHRINVDTRKVELVAGGQCDYSGLTLAGEGHVIACRHSMLEPDEVWSIKAGKEPERLSAITDPIMTTLGNVTCHKEIIKTTDGKDMTTWVLLPPDFDSNKKYPSLLFCEGGPQSPVSQFWSYRWNLRIMAENGYVVIAPNRRGLPGFGTEWNAEISGDYSGQCMKDYLSAVDYMKEKPYIDGKRMGAVGASFGGFSVYWLAGNHNKRFACFLAHAGIFDLRAQYCETEEMWFANWDLGGAPWDFDNATAMRTYREADPKNYVQNWDTPIMVVTGENDFRISYTQTMQAFNAAKMRGVPTRMVLFPSECHWVTKPQNSILWQREFFRWLDQWLKK